MNTLGKKSAKNRPNFFQNILLKYAWNVTNISYIVEDNELRLLQLYFAQVIVSNSSFFGLVLRITKRLILWRHQLWRHKNEIWEFKSDTFFNSVYFVFLQSITVSGSKLLKEKLLEVLIF